MEDAPEAVFRIWGVRERVEWEAADQFARLARALREQYGAGDRVAAMAEAAAGDERRHAALCRAILDRSPAALEPYVPGPALPLGPISLRPAASALYATVALSCVTETLSAALLVEMHDKARPGIIRRTVHEILEDEVSHSRLGWAALARAASARDVSWLSRYVPGMLRDAIAGDVGPLVRASETGLDLSAWGILPPRRAREVVSRAVSDVILPGLARFGIPVDEAAGAARTALEAAPR